MPTLLLGTLGLIAIAVLGYLQWYRGDMPTCPICANKGKTNRVPRYKYHHYGKRCEKCFKETPEYILREFRNLQKAPSGEAHKVQYLALRRHVKNHKEALLELIFSGAATEDELSTLIWFCGHGGSCTKADNINWVDFVANVRARQDELPWKIRTTLDWYLRVHGW